MLGHPRFVGNGVGDELGQRIPLRRRPAELLRVFDRQGLEVLLLSGGAVEVEQHEPGFGVLGAAAVGSGELAQRFFALHEIGVRKSDHGLVELGVVLDFADLDDERPTEF